MYFYASDLIYGLKTAYVDSGRVGIKVGTKVGVRRDRGEVDLREENENANVYKILEIIYVFIFSGTQKTILIDYNVIIF